MIHNLKPYPAYKDSGSRFIGMIPRHWDQRCLWSVSKLRTDRNPGDLPLLSVFLDRGVIPYSEGSGQVHAPSLDLSNYQIVCPGDFVLNNQQAWRGSVGVSRYHGIISPAYIVLGLSERLDSAFANYLMRCPRMIDQFVVASKGVGDIQRQIYWPFLLRTVQVPIPNSDDQIAIVRFLDHANVRINRIMQAKKKLIALLNEQKDAIIHRAVTRGLDPTLPLKPSGISWLGDIPKHWKVKRIKYLLSEVDRRSTTGSEPLLSLRMHHGLVLFAEHFSRPPQAATLVGFKIVQPGQFVVNRMQAGNGLIFASTLMGLVSPDYAVFDPIGDANVDFLGELFRSRKVRTKFRAESKGLGTGSSGFLRLYNDRLGAIHVPLPPSREQAAILTVLTDELKTANLSLELAEREIALLHEYRMRVTADVVTGKLDVREAARKLPEVSVEPEATLESNSELAEIEAEDVEV